jgi:predicted transcriptional regulator with HTH domain
VEVAAMTLATLQQSSNALQTILSLLYKIFGSHSSVAEVSSLVGYDAVSSGE